MKTSEHVRAINNKARAKRLSTAEGREAERAYQRAYKEKNWETIARKDALSQRKRGNIIRLQRKGLSVDLLPIVENATTCDICGGPPTGRWGTLHIDHCHATGAFRGMLCDHCNHGIAKFKDSPTVLRRAADYLEKQVPVT